MPEPKSDNPFLNNVERLEPGMWNGWSGSSSVADISIAISLKRIADALETGMVDTNEYGERGFALIGRAIIQGLQR